MVRVEHLISRIQDDIFSTAILWTHWYTVVLYYEKSLSGGLAQRVPHFSRNSDSITTHKLIFTDKKNILWKIVKNYLKMWHIWNMVLL